MAKKKVQFECKRCHLIIEAVDEPEYRLCKLCRKYIDLDKVILKQDQETRKAYFDSASKSKQFRKRKARKKKEEKIPQKKLQDWLK